MFWKLLKRNLTREKVSYVYIIIHILSVLYSNPSNHTATCFKLEKDGITIGAELSRIIGLYIKYHALKEAWFSHKIIEIYAIQIVTLTCIAFIFNLYANLLTN